MTDIKNSFVDILTDATWMTEEVRNRSIKKVIYMRVAVVGDVAD